MELTILGLQKGLCTIKDPESYNRIQMLSHAIWALFWPILIQNWKKKKT